MRAGVDIELPDPDCYPLLVELVREGTVAGVADRRPGPARCCAAKFQLGLFDDPYVDPDAGRAASCGSPRTATLALEAARKTITLLKNDGGVLPLDPSAIRTIAVIGPERRSRDARRLQRRAAPLEHGARRGSGTALPAGVEVAVPRGLQDHRRRLVEQDEVTPERSRGGPAQHRARRRRSRRRPTWWCWRSATTSRPRARPGRSNHLGDRAEPRPRRAAGRAGGRDRRDRQADRRAALQRPARRRSRNLAAKAAAILELWYLGQEIGPRHRRGAVRRREPGRQAARSRSRARSATCRPTTTTSRRRGAATCSTTVDPLFAFGYGLSYTTFALREPAPREAGDRRGRDRRAFSWT